LLILAIHALGLLLGHFDVGFGVNKVFFHDLPIVSTMNI
jgi:hypothetical protein